MVAWHICKTMWGLQPELTNCWNHSNWTLYLELKVSGRCLEEAKNIKENLGYIFVLYFLTGRHWVNIFGVPCQKPSSEEISWSLGCLQMSHTTFKALKMYLPNDDSCDSRSWAASWAISVTDGSGGLERVGMDCCLTGLEPARSISLLPVGWRMK